MKSLYAISGEDTDRLLQFLGYGNPSGPFWFVGMEEAGNLSKDEVLTRAREFHPIDDLARVHSLPGYWMDTTKLIPTWSAMCRLVLRISCNPAWQDREAVRAYQSEKLGRIGGATFLTELLPLPCPSTASWPYSTVFPTRETYAASIIPSRILRLRAVFKESQPQYVFCYGKTYWPYFEEIFRISRFHDLEQGRVRIACVDRGWLVLTEFFSRYFMTDPRIEAIASYLESHGSDSAK